MPIKKTKDEKKDPDKKVKNSSSKTQPMKELTPDTGSDVVDYVQEDPVSDLPITPIKSDDDPSIVEKREYQAPKLGSYSGGYGYSGSTIKISGILEVLTDYGVIRQNQESSADDLPKDVYISHSQIKRFGLRMGDTLTGLARPPKENERYLSLLKIETVGGEDPEKAKKRPMFSKLTPIFPNEWLKLETKPDVISTRLIDLISPIGKGQRAMLVAPPKAGKTFLLLDVANGITTNYPDVTLLVALIGERPEEVTHFARSVKGEVFASNFDEKAEEQTRISELCL